ncbi:MAG: hypothetical protein ACRYF2_05580 [Janthinobacterium lividum]
MDWTASETIIPQQGSSANTEITARFEVDWIAHPMSEQQLEDFAVINMSGKFDYDWYYEQYPDVVESKRNGIQHYVQHGAAEGRHPNGVFKSNIYLARTGNAVAAGKNSFAEFLRTGSEDDLFEHGLLDAFTATSLRTGIARLRRLPIYSDADYLRMNHDVGAGGLPPAQHALTFGFPEGRCVFDKRTISLALGVVSDANFRTDRPVAVSAGAMPQTVGIFFNSLGNGFIREIAEDLVLSFHNMGVDARLLDETSDPDSRPACCIFVAPHEFFHLGRGSDWATDEIVSQAFMLNTEQPQTLWFDRGAPFLLMCRGVIDICDQTAMLFASAGMPALHFNSEIAPVSRWLHDDDEDHPLVRVLPPRARATPDPSRSFGDRPIDISFFGGTSAHRDGFFCRNAQFLSDFRCFLYYRRFEGPHTSSKRDGILSRLGGHVTAHSSISLNIHRDDYGFFEWHRIVKIGMAGGSVVVSEPCLPHPLYKPGIHFFEECGRHMPDLMDWLLRTGDGRAKAEQVRVAALKLVHDEAAVSCGRMQLRTFISENWSGLS